MSQADKDAEEAEVKKLMKEKSASLIGQSLVQLSKLCMPKCITLSTSHVDPKETACLKECVRTLHKSHVQVFNHMLEFEARQEREEDELATRMAIEAAEEERRRVELEKERAREESGMVKM